MKIGFRKLTLDSIILIGKYLEREIRVKSTNAQLIKRSNARVEHDARLIRLIASLIAAESKSSITLLSIRLSIGPEGSINNHRFPLLLAGCPGSERLYW